MITSGFTRESSEGLVVIQCQFVEHEVALALDTGASHTVIDLTALLIADYALADAIRTTLVETASGIIEAYVFRVQSFTALGITRTNFEVCAYDFFAKHVLIDFDGVLGLDFIADYHICIDFRASTITLS